MRYTPVHLHSDASLLDGLSKCKDIAKRFKEIGATGGALTDHGVLSNAIQFLKEMDKAKLKPILGIELYISPEHASIQTPENRKCSHLVVLAKNTQGWKQILKIVAEANTNYYYRPRLSLEQLAPHLDGNVIGFSGHLGSDVANSIMEFGEDSAEKTVLYLNNIFGAGNFWLECQLMDKKHNPEQIKVTDIVRSISKKTGIPCIATPDAHYCKHEDSELQRILLCSNMGVTMKKAMEPDFQLRAFFISDNFHIPTYDEMISYGHTVEELENTNNILDQIETYDILSEPQLPAFSCPNNMTEDEYVTQLCREGWKNLITGKIPQEKIQDYVDRVKYELEVITRNKLSGYFLILWDVMQYCVKNDWLTGVGRGSAAGCIVSYLLGITKIDPIKYDLLFERFYNDGRAGSLPDIDSDFEIEHRDDIIEYIKNKYGIDRVTQILTFQNMKGARALKEVFRAYGDIPYEEINRITKNIIEEHKITDELQAMEEEEEGSASIIRWCLENRSKYFKEWCEFDDDGNLTGPYAERFGQAIRLEGVKAAQSKHAAGIVVSKNPLAEICPMVYDTKNKNTLGGWTMGDMEAGGLVKMDMLGLSFLSKMSMIRKLNPAFNTNFYELEPNDKATWDLFGTGKTKGCFQLESKLGQAWSKKLKPESIEHLSALVAILRPGCLESTLEDGKSITEHYCMRKNNEEEITYNNDALKSVLEKTYGLLIYQEGAMQLAQKLAGFDLKQADVLRKAIGKKKADLMAKVKTEFFEGVEKVGLVSKEIAEEVFGWIEKSQRYSFNKSHSISYGMLSYLSGYAKQHFPLEFYTAYLAHAQDRLNPQQEIYELINDAKSFGIYVQPPNILKLNKHFDLIDGQIYFGLADIKHVGESVVDKLIPYKDYLTNWYTFLTIVADNINSRALEGLINSGALDCFKMSRTEMVFQYTIWNQLSGREKKWINNATVQIDLKNSKETLKNVLLALTHGGTTGKTSGCANKNRLAKVLGLIESINNPPYDMHDKPHQIAQLENTLLGICLTATFLDESEQKYMANCTCQEFNDGFNSKNNHIAMAVQIDAIRETTTKKGTDPGRTMAFVTASDDSGICDNIVAFPDSYEKHKNLLVEGNRVLICGTRTKSNSLSIENLQQI